MATLNPLQVSSSTLPNFFKQAGDVAGETIFAKTPTGEIVTYDLRELVPGGFRNDRSRTEQLAEAQREFERLTGQSFNNLPEANIGDIRQRDIQFAKGSFNDLRRGDISIGSPAFFSPATTSEPSAETRQLNTTPAGYNILPGQPTTEQLLARSLPSQVSGTSAIAPSPAPFTGVGSTPSPATNTASVTGDPVYDQLLSTLNDYLEELKARGQVLNPNIEITPEQIAEFTAQAQAEIDPYYAGQLKLARGDLLRSVGYSENEILSQEQELERTYGRNLRTLGEQAAEQGFAQSGIRRRSESELAQDTQSTIEASRRQLAFNAGTAASQFAQQYGSAQLPSFNIAEAPRVLSGVSGFQKTGRELPLFELSPALTEGLIGEQEFQRRAAVRQRTSEQEAAQRELSALSQQRQLIL